MSYLLDTNVLSELNKRVKNPGLLDWLAETRRGEHFVSVLTLGETYQGISHLRGRGDHQQADALEQFAVRTEERFANRILPVTTSIAREWGRQSHHQPIPAVDGLIAATARVHDVTVVTRNDSDFIATGARVLNPFS